MAVYRPSVTVLMPVYNAAAYLNASVASILWQTYRDFEFLIVDDGSTDGSDAILSDFASRDSRIRVFQIGHQGVVAAINRGLAEAKGDIIVRMDADDIAWPKRIERQWAFLGSNPQIAAVGCAVRIIDSRGRPIGTGRYPISPAEVLESLNSGITPLGAPTSALRRDALIAVGGFRPLFDYAEDFDLLLRLSERHDLANLPETLLDYRVHGHNTSLRHRREQALAAQIAKLSARERRLGHPEPTGSLDRLRLTDLDRFDILPHERISILFDLSEAALVSYEASGTARYLSDAEQSLFIIQGYPHPARARRIARRLARYWRHEHDHRRCLAALGWVLQSELSRLKPIFVQVRSELRREKSDRRRIALEWMVHCADPTGPKTEPPRQKLPSEAATELVAQADAHGVLPAILRQFPPFANDSAFTPAKMDAAARNRQSLAMAAMLRQCADDLVAAAAGLPVAVVKGPAFGRIIYPDIAMRPFTDIDLLVAPECVAEVSKLLANDGFTLAEGDDGQHRREWKWLHRDNVALMVEVHTDLVHAKSLRGALSLTYDDIAGASDTTAVQLIVAVVHGSVGKHFDKLRSLVDICQAARLVTTANDEACFEALVARTGARLAARTGLELAGRMFGEPRCLELARALGPVCYSGIARLLIDGSVVTSTHTPGRLLYSWRRQAFRQLLKRTPQRAVV